MSIFISYRHVDPDESFALFLERRLRERGYPVFIDQRMRVGTLWADEISRQIRRAKHFIILLSKDSIRSVMVRQEVKEAHELEGGTRPAILPIRVDFRGALPYDLGGYLNGLQYAQWSPRDPMEATLEQLLAAIEQAQDLPHAPLSEGEPGSKEAIGELYDATEAQGIPLPNADPRLVSDLILDDGVMRPNSPYYIERRIDRDVWREVAAATGSTVLIRGPSQMGKSSLMARIARRAKNERHRAVFLDFKRRFDESQLASLDTFAKQFANVLARELKTIRKPSESWRRP